MKDLPEAPPVGEGGEPDEPSLSLRRAHSELFRAVIDGRTDTLVRLLNSGTDVDERDHRQRTPLHVACELGSFSSARMLIRHGARVEARDSNRHTPLHYAAYGGFLDCVRGLLQAGANPDCRDDMLRAPLHMASVGYPAIAKELVVAGGANPDIGDKYQQTPLHLAAAMGKQGCVRQLVKLRANIRARDGRHRSPLNRAIKGGRLGCVVILASETLLSMMGMPESSRSSVRSTQSGLSDDDETTGKIIWGGSTLVKGIVRVYLDKTSTEYKMFAVEPHTTVSDLAVLVSRKMAVAPDASTASLDVFRATFVDDTNRERSCQPKEHVAELLMGVAGTQPWRHCKLIIEPVVAPGDDAQLSEDVADLLGSFRIPKTVKSPLVPSKPPAGAPPKPPTINLTSTSTRQPVDDEDAGAEAEPEPEPEPESKAAAVPEAASPEVPATEVEEPVQEHDSRDSLALLVELSKLASARRQSAPPPRKSSGNVDAGAAENTASHSWRESDEDEELSELLSQLSTIVQPAAAAAEEAPPEDKPEDKAAKKRPGDEELARPENLDDFDLLIAKLYEDDHASTTSLRGSVRAAAKAVISG